MSISLDIGTSRLRSLRRAGDELIARSVPATFALLPDDPSTRELLTRADIGFAVGDGELALVGDAAVRHATVFRSAPLRLLSGGLVPADDPPARQMLGTLIESLLPEAEAPGSLCGLVLPDAVITDKTSREFLSRLVWMRGYEPVLLSATQAAALATLSAEAFTGVTLSLGAGGCAIGLLHRGEELAFGSTPRGCDWIDTHLAASQRCFLHDTAGMRYLDTETIRRRRESMPTALAEPSDDFGRQLADCYREILGETLTELAERIAHDQPGPFADPLPLVCTGGGTQAAGFADLLADVLRQVNLPIDLAEPQILSDDYLIARGGLIHAELEVNCAAA